MTKNEKMWAMLVHLSINVSERHDAESFSDNFDDTFWDYVVEEAAKSGINTIVLDVNDGVEFGSHPEIAKEGCWTRRKMRKEIARCKELGITLYPKLNFSSTHSHWLGEYRKKTSTTEYYQVCNDLIIACRRRNFADKIPGRVMTLPYGIIFRILQKISTVKHPCKIVDRCIGI